jgi:hypothetical protein
MHCQTPPLLHSARCRLKSTCDIWRSMSRESSCSTSCGTGVLCVLYCPSMCVSATLTRGGRIAPCLLRTHKDVEASSLVAAFLLRHSGAAAEAVDVSSADGASVLAAPSIALVTVSTPVSVKPTLAAHSPAASTRPLAAPSAAAAQNSEQGGPPSRLPPPAPSAAPAAALPRASGGELLLPQNKSRSRSGSLEGNSGYASFKKELQVSLVSSLNFARILVTRT